MGRNFNIKYNIDIVLCIDATAGMNYPIDMLKTHAMSFYTDVTGAIENGGRHIDQLRVRVIVFRDYLADGKDAMLATDFFSLPDQAAEFKEILNSIRAQGGGDNPEDGLEALAYAIKSKWTHSGDKRRHIIVVWSDDGTHELGFGAKAENYPKKMAKDFDELTEWWGDRFQKQPGLMDQNAKRLILLAPEKKYWSTITESWDAVIHYPVEPDRGLYKLDYDEIIDAIVCAI